MSGNRERVDARTASLASIWGESATARLVGFKGCWHFHFSTASINQGRIEIFHQERDTEELVDKLLETATSAEDPLRAMAEMVADFCNGGSDGQGRCCAVRAQRRIDPRTATVAGTGAGTRGWARYGEGAQAHVILLSYAAFCVNPPTSGRMLASGRTSDTGVGVSSSQIIRRTGVDWQ